MNASLPLRAWQPSPTGHPSRVPTLGPIILTPSHSCLDVLGLTIGWTIRCSPQNHGADSEVDRGTEVTIRCAGEWAIHVESTRRTLEEWKELHALYDIQVAAATDGGRQLDEHGH